MITGAAGYCIPALGEERDYALWKDPVQVDADMLRLAKDSIAKEVGASKVPQQSAVDQTIFMLYE